MSADANPGGTALAQMVRETTLARGLSGPVPAVRVLMALLVVVGALEWIVASRLAAGTPPLTAAHMLALGANDAGSVAAGQVWRMFTASWLHADAGHLLINVMAVGVLGALVERLYGSRRFVVIWLVTTLVGNAAHVVWVTQPAVGASAGIAGLGGVLAVFALANRSWLPRRIVNLLLSQSAFVMGALWVLGLGNERVDHVAHLGGLVAGVAIAAAMRTGVELGAARRWMLQVASALLVGGTLWGFAMMAVEWRRCGQDTVDWTVCYGSWVGIEPISEPAVLDEAGESN